MFSKVSLFFYAIIVVFFSCQQAENKNISSQTALEQDTSYMSSWLTYQTSTYQIKYPPNWQLDSSGQLGTRFMIYSPQESADDQFKENINVISDSLPPNINLRDYTATTEEQITELVTNAKIFESSIETINGQELYKIVFIGQQGNLLLKYKQYFIIRNQAAHVITFTATSETFDDYEDVGTEIMNTFRIL